MIQINPLQRYIDGGARAAITTPPSASLVFDLPGKAIWVKGVKLKGTDHTYTFSHDNYISLTNTPGSNESEDIKIGINTTLLKQAIDTTYGIVNATTNGLAPMFSSANKATAAAATTYNFLGIAGTTLKWYSLPWRNVRINAETSDKLGVNDTDPLIISQGTGISVTWDSSGKKIVITNTAPDQNHNTDSNVAQTRTVQNKNYPLILKGSADDTGIIAGVNFNESITYNPSTLRLLINSQRVVTVADVYVGATASAAATSGLVPAATSALRTYFLRGDGTWATPQDYNTWRPIKVNSSEKLGSGTNTGAVDFVAGTGITLGWDATNKKITITNSAPDVNHNTDRTGVKLGTVTGSKKTDGTLIITNSSAGLVFQGGTNLFKIGDGTNYIEVPVTPSFTVSNKAATIGRSLTTIATINGTDITAKIADYVAYYHNASTNPNIDAFTDWAYLLTVADTGSYGSGTKASGSHNGFGVLNLHTHSGNYYTQLGLDTNLNRLWIRSANNVTSFGAWSMIADAGNISNKDATIGTSSTTIATIAGVDITAKIGSYAASGHTHSVKINGSTKTIAAPGGTAVDLGSYLPLTGGTLEANNSWLSPARLQLMRPDSSTYTDRACIGVTNGNLHIDAYKDYGLYLNYYSSGGAVYFNGSTYYIKGGNYNGNSATASKWQTARTLTIGNTGKSVDGSANVSWTLAEIGAAASNHTHPLSIAADSGTNQLTLAPSSKYKLTAGGSTFIFTTPTDENVKQTNNDNNQDSPILLKNGTGTGQITSGTIFADGITVNPSSNSLGVTGNITLGGTIYFGASGWKTLLAYNSSYPKYGIWYNDTNVDQMTFSASGNADTAAGADFCINGAGDGTLTARGNLILHSGNYTSYVNPRATSKSMWGGTYIDASGNFQSFAGNFNMSTGDLINMTGANWDGFAFNYSSGKGTTQSTRFYNGNGGEIVRFTGGGSVGIGTSSPGYKLDVVGNGQFTYAASNGYPALKLNLSADNDWAYGLQVMNSNLTANHRIGAVWMGKAHSAHNGFIWEYYHVADGNSSNRIVLHDHGIGDLFSFLGNGNMGIGTVSPVTKLDVRGVDKVSMSMDAANGYRFSPSFKGTVHLAHASHGSGSGINNGYIDGITFGVNAAAYAGIFVQNSGSYGSRMIFTTTNDYSYNKARMILDAGGRVGIGTMSPDHYLSVAGEHGISTFYGFNYHPCYTDGAGRPGLSISGWYPYIWLTGGNRTNVNHGATFTLSALNDGSATSGAFKAWTFGVPGYNATWMDLGYGSSANPHEHGIAGYKSGWSGRVMRFTPDQITIWGTGNNCVPTLLVNSSRNSSWTYGGGFMAPNLTGGNNIYVPVGQSMSTRNAIGLTHYHYGSGSTSNYAAMEIWGVGNIQRWYYGDLRTWFAGRVDSSGFYHNSYGSPDYFLTSDGGAKHWSWLDNYYLRLFRRINSNGASTNSDTIPPSILEFKNGYPLHTDPEFSSGYNDMSTYDNNGSGNTYLTRETSSNCGNSSGYVIKVTSGSGASPGYGGWYFADWCTVNTDMTCIFRALIPSGVSVEWASNSIGSGGTGYWLTEHVGTGKYEWYAYHVKCGTGSESNTFFFYVTTPCTWYISFANTYRNTWANYDGLRTRYSDYASSAGSIAWDNITGKPGAAGSASVPVYWTGSGFGTCIVSFGNSSNGEHNANSITDNGIKYYTSNGPSGQLGARSTDGALYSQAYNTSWVAQIAQDYRDGGLYVRGRNNGTWQKWLQVMLVDLTSSAVTNCNSVYRTGIYTHSGFSNRPSGVSNWGTLLNYKLYEDNNSYHRQIFLDCYGTNRIWTRANNGGTWTGWDELVRNTGTWSINITGNAATATSATNAANLLPENSAHYFRDPNSASWRGGMIWGSAGSESMSFVVANSGTRFQFVGGSDIANWGSSTWQSANPYLTIYSSGIVTSGSATATGFIKNDSSDSYVLLGGGGHKAISDFWHKDNSTVLVELHIDARGLNENTYYPVTISLVWGRSHIECYNHLSGHSKPSWSTHSNGFSVNVAWDTNPSGWGTIGVMRNIHTSAYAWSNVYPVGSIGQLTSSSYEYIYVRGGGFYYFRLTSGCSVTLHTSSYEIYGLTLAPTSSVSWPVAEWGLSFYAPHFYESSDIRLKHDILSISESIRLFRFNDDNKLYYGFIALELEVEHPELVDSSGEYKKVNYDSAICYYIAELENKVQKLEDEINKLKNK